MKCFRCGDPCWVDIVCLAEFIRPEGCDYFRQRTEPICEGCIVLMQEVGISSFLKEKGTEAHTGIIPE